jgi:hypothetical protein
MFFESVNCVEILGKFDQNTAIYVKKIIQAISVSS